MSYSASTNRPILTLDDLIDKILFGKDVSHVRTHGLLPCTVWSVALPRTAGSLDRARAFVGASPASANPDYP